MVPGEEPGREITLRSILFGLSMTVLFSAAAAYIALKLGQGIESAIPISILAIGLSAVLARKSALLENVQIATLGTTAGVVVGGAVFVMPAVFVLGLEERSSFFQVFLVPLLGAVLGVFYLLPFRRYFVAEMHGKLPFPEGTAITEILVAGARGGKQAGVLLRALGVGIVVDYLALNLHAWRDTFTTVLVQPLRHLTEDVKAIFVLNTSAAVMGLGYIVGLRFAAIIAAGSFLSYWVFVPLLGHLGPHLQNDVFPGRPPLAGLDAEGIFFDYVRYIGIGAIFAAGVLSILRMAPVIGQAVRRVFSEIARMRHGRGAGAGTVRVDRDIPMPIVALGTAVLAVVLFVYFRFAVLSRIEGATRIALIALVLTMGIAFLFAAVSAWAVAMISTTPVSGMTLTTLILSAVLLSNLGLSGPDGMVAVLLIGGVVCTALSMTGSMVTMLKVGYWTGSTPKRIQWSLIAGSILASVTVTAVILLFQETYGYVRTDLHPNPVPAPQANAMAAVIQSVMASGNAPWILYGLGAVIAVVVQMTGVSALAFALGMYLPIELNTPILAGALVGWLIKRPSGDKALDLARANRGTLLASGLIAGGALAGVLDGLVKFVEDRWEWTLSYDFDATGVGGNNLGLLVFLLLAAWFAWNARRAKPEEGSGPELSL
jgi:putative OPT family oligopeptide transporter